MPLRLKAFLFSSSLLDCMPLSGVLQELSMCSQLVLLGLSIQEACITSAYSEGGILF